VTLLGFFIVIDRQLVITFTLNEEAYWPFLVFPLQDRNRWR
jgi:hypothetical protein